MASIATALLTGNNFESICGDRSWRVYFCNNVPVVCVDCKQNCEPTVSCPGTNAVVNPCGACTERASAASIINFQYAYRIYYPQFTSNIRIVPSRHALTLNFSVSGHGSISCLSTVGTNIPSIPTIMKSGVTYYTNLTIGANATIPASLILGSLYPDTKFTVYCVTADLLGHVMPFETVARNKLTARTLCCRELFYSRTYSSISQYIAGSGRVESVFQVSLDSPPTAQLLVSITVSQINCKSPFNAVAPTVSVSALPSQFLVPANTSELTYSFVIRASATGCFHVLAMPYSASGADEYVNASTRVTVFTQKIPPSPPVIVMAQLASDGRNVTVYLDSASDQAATVLASPNGQFSCAVVLVFEGASKSNCIWLSTSIIVVFPSQLLLPGSGIALLPNSTKAACAFGSVPVCSKYKYSSSKLVNISAPATPALVTVALTSSAVVSLCDDIVLDPQGSSGMVAGGWSMVEWSVTAVGNAIFPTNMTTIVVWLNSRFASTSGLATVPRAMLTAGVYTFTLKLSNILGAFGLGSTVVTVSTESSIPRIQIPGSSSLVFYRWQSIVIQAVAALPSCSSANVSQQMTFTWKVYDGRTFLSSLNTQQSLNPRTLKLPPFSLTESHYYTVQVTVTLGLVTPKAPQAAASVALYIQASGLVASIAGGSSQTKYAATGFLLDASSSVSLDYPTATLAYAWTCLISSPAYGSPCSYDFSRFNSAIISVPANSLPESSYSITVTVSRPTFSQESASTSVIVTIVKKVIPEISMGATASKYNPGDTIILNGTITGTQSLQSVWISPNFTSLQLSTMASTQTSLTTVNPSGLPLIVPFEITLRPYSLTAGLRYTFAISAVYGNMSSGNLIATSYISIVLNTPPMNGVFTVTPTSGQALNTTFLLQTGNWQDDATDYPLTYGFSCYQVSSSQRTILKPSSVVAYVSAYLGQGLSSLNYKVWNLVITSDYYGATANLTTTVVVSALDTSTEYGASAAAAISVSFENNNVQQVMQIVSATAVALTAVSCSVPYRCGSLNRNPCAATPNTCGPCLHGFVGADGDANLPCVSERSTNSSRRLSSFSSSSGLSMHSAASTSSCSQNSSCTSGWCNAGSCALTLKTCPSDCTGRGTCTFEDYNGVSVESCLASDPYCSATCKCDTRRFGWDCSLTQDEWAKEVQVMNVICASTLHSLTIQEFSADVILSIASLISSSMVDPTIVSNSSLAACGLALATIVNFDPSSACSISNVNAVFSALSALLLKGRGTPSSITAIVDATMMNLVSGCQLQLATGQNSLDLISTNIRLSTAVARIVDLSNVQLTVPLTGFESSEGTLTSAVGLLPDAVLASSLNASIAPAGYVAVEYLNNPGNITATGSVVGIQVNTFDLFSTSSTGYYVELVLQNFESVSYSYIARMQLPLVFCERSKSSYSLNRSCPDGSIVRVECPGEEGYFNITCGYRSVEPICTSSDGVQFASDPDCAVVAFSPTNITCRCLVSSSSSRRSLKQISGSSELLLYSATQHTVEETIPVQWLLAPLIQESLNNAVVVPALGAVLGIIVIGTIVVMAWDWRWKALLAAAVHASKEDTKSSRTFSGFFESIFPDELRADRWYKGYMHWLFRKHQILSLFYPRFVGRQDFYTAFNYLLAALRVFHYVLISTVVIGIVYPDNGTCEAIHDANECLSQRSVGTSRHLCRWDEYWRYCTFHTPPRGDIFTIILLLAVVTAVSIPLHKLSKFLVRHVASSHEQGTEKALQKAALLATCGVADYRLDEFQLAQTPRSTLLRAARLDKAQRTMDFVLPEEEAAALVLQGEQDFGRQFSHQIFQHTMDEFSFKKLRYGFTKLDPTDLLRRVRVARKDAGRIRAELDRLPRDEDKEAFLIKSFVVDYFSGMERSVLRRYFFPHWESAKTGRMRALRRMICCILLPAYIVGGIFMIAFFSIPLGSRAAYYWTTVLVLAVCEDLALVQPIAIWIRMTVLTTLVRDDCRHLLTDLKKQGRLILMRTWGLLRHSNSLVQHFNPACRAARMFPHLPVSRFLLSLSDYDLPIPRQFQRHDWFWHVSTVLFPFGLLPPLIQDAILEMGTSGMVNGLLLALALLSQVSPAGAILVAFGIVMLVLLREGAISYGSWAQAQAVREKHTKNMFYSIEEEEFDLQDRNVDFASIDQSKFVQVESPVGRSAGRFRALFGLQGDRAEGETRGDNFAINTIVLAPDETDEPNMSFPVFGESSDLEPPAASSPQAQAVTAPGQLQESSFATLPTFQTLQTMSMTTFDRTVAIQGPPISSHQPRQLPSMGPGAVHIQASLDRIDTADPPSPDSETEGRYGLQLRTLRETGLRRPPQSLVSSSTSALSVQQLQKEEGGPLVSRSLQIDRSERAPLSANHANDAGGGVAEADDASANGSNATNNSKLSRTKARKARSIERGRRLRTLATQQGDDDMSIPSQAAPNAAVQQAAGDMFGNSEDEFSIGQSVGSQRRRSRQGRSRVLQDQGRGPGAVPERALGFDGANANHAVNFTASSADTVPLPVVEADDRIPAPQSPVQPTPARSNEAVAGAGVMAAASPPLPHGRQGGNNEPKYPTFY